MNFKHYNTNRLLVLIVLLFLLESMALQLIKTYTYQFPKQWQTIIDVSGATGSLVLVSLFLKWYDNKLWKYGVGIMRIVNVPNLNGTYEGELISSYIDQTTGEKTKLKCVMRVHQTASRIYIEMDFINSNNTTTSKSHSEQVEDTPADYKIIRFIHYNGGSFDNMELSQHHGLTELQYYPGTKEFKGTYFNSPQRKTHGTIHVKKVA